jgi:soluble lytic murein transglycosylase-like protein
MERRFKVSAIVAFATPLLLVGFPTTQAAPDRQPAPPPPSVEELRLLEELALWVGDPVGAAESEMEVADLPSAVRSRRAGFELFRNYNHREEHRAVLARLPYGRLIQAVAEEQGVDGLLLAAVVRVESRFDPTAVSHRGALGLMQLMPETAGMYGVVDPFDPTANIRAGARYLRHLLAIYAGDLELALAAYNAGPGSVARFGGVPPFPETQGYVAAVLSAYVSFHRRLWDDSELTVLLRTVNPPYEELDATPAAAESTVLAVVDGPAG